MLQKIKITCIVALALMLSSCTSNESVNKRLTIVSNAWIGYAPLFYAEQKGYLKDINIKVIPVVSLAEASDTFLVGKADMVTTTQHEYRTIKKEVKDITPIILLDRSNGGDMILSNKNTKELKSAEKIYAYLEVDSINYDLLDSFLKKQHISMDKIIFNNEDQSSISGLRYVNKPILIVTYVPYDTFLKKRGYKVIASTKDINSLVVIDSLCTTRLVIEKNAQRLKKLKTIIDRSIKEIMSNKKSAYKLLSPYLDNISYESYIDAFNTIKWVNNPSENFLKIIKPLGYNKKDLVN